MATQLSVYNEALEVLGETPMTVITEQRPVRRTFDNIWANGGREACLAKGYWNFAARTVQLSADPDVTPSFGFANAFSQPNDFVKVMALCSDEYMQSTIENYTEEAGFFYAEENEIYLQYVSKDETKGLNVASWPELFATYVAHYLANRVKNQHVKDRRRRKEIGDDTKMALREARNFDAMNQPSQRPQEGRWQNARRGNSARRDRGSRSSLIG